METNLAVLGVSGWGVLGEEDKAVWGAAVRSVIPYGPDGARVVASSPSSGY